MERTEVLDMMSGLKLYGMRSAYDETLATALKRKHEPQRFVGDLLKAEISEKQARSIKYQLTVAKLPLAKDVDDFAFKDTPINEALVRDLAAGGFIAQQRNVVLVGGTGTGKTHRAIAVARSCIRAGSDAAPGDCDGQMGLAGAGAADQHDVALLGDEAAAGEIVDKGLVDRRAVELEVIDVLGEGKLGDRELVFDRSRLLLTDLGAEQIADNALRFVLSFDGRGHNLVEGSLHAVELELAHEVKELSSFHQMVLLRLS